MLASLTKQIQFIIEVDKLKAVLRQTSPIGLQRRENSAEHSWQAVLLAMTVAEHANVDIDLLKVVKMLALHDVVEIDVGDVFHYDKSAQADLHEQELAAAKRIFGLLDEPQATEYLSIWQEFEQRQTPEAQYAAAIDRLLPVIINHQNHGGTWKRNELRADQVLGKNAHIAEGSAHLWALAQQIVQDCQDKGYLKDAMAAKLPR